MAGNGTTNFPFTKGNILPDTPTTATQTHPLSGTKSIGGKKHKLANLEKKKKTKGGKEDSSEEVIEKISEVAEVIPVGGKKSKKNKRNSNRRRKTKKFLWFF